jgi:subtilisin family serine protease
VQRTLAGSLTLALALVPVLAGTPARALDDDLYARQWGLEITGAKAAWDRGLFGAGADVAVVDTGAHLSHQDLVKNIRPGLNLVEPGKPPQDDWCDRDACGHGTHVAGIAVASIDDGGSVGVAPRAGLIPVKGFGSSGGASTETLARGVRWAADQGAEAINMSFGPDLPIEGTGTEIIEAIRYAWSKGSICVISAGNSFLFSSDIENEPAIVVSATNRRDGEPDFSNGVGDARWGLAAPGGGNTVQFESDENIWSTVWRPEGRNDTYDEMRGTSQAAPFVSGAVAVLRGAGLSPQQTVDRLLATAKDLGPAGRDATFGAGRLDIAKATAGLTSQPAAPTTTAANATAPTTARAASPTTARLRPPPAPAPTQTAPATPTPSTAGPGESTTIGLAPPATGEIERALESARGPTSATDDQREGPSPWLAAAAGALVLGTAGTALALHVNRRAAAQQ